MKTVEWPVISGHSIFCDDIRIEEGGKLSFIGVYQSIMYIHGDFPFTIPKFGIFLSYREKVGERTHSLTFKVFMPGDSEDIPTIAGEVPMAELRKAHEELARAEQRKRESDGWPVEPIYYDFGANFTFAPLILKKPGAIRVRAFCGDEIIKMGSLRVEKVPAPTPPASA